MIVKIVVVCFSNQALSNHYRKIHNKFVFFIKFRQQRRLSKRSLEQADPDATPHSMSERSKLLSRQLAEAQDDDVIT